MRPKRIQRRRTKGWRMPEGTIYVGRPTKWGNPYLPDKSGDHQPAIDAYRAAFTPELIAHARRELAGHDLACWCPLDQPCHADVLLKLANVGAA